MSSMACSQSYISPLPQDPLRFRELPALMLPRTVLKLPPMLEMEPRGRIALNARWVMVTMESEREGEPMSQLAKTSGTGAGGSSFAMGAGDGATLSLSDPEDSTTDAMDVVDE